MENLQDVGNGNVIKGCSLVGSILYFNPQGIMEEVKDLGNIVDMRDMFEVLGSK